MSKKTLILHINLQLKAEDAEEAVVNVKQTVPLESILEPVFINDGAKFIENLVKLLGTDCFNNLTRAYFANQIEQFNAPKDLLEHKTVIDTLPDASVQSKLALTIEDTENIQESLQNETDLDIEKIIPDGNTTSDDYQLNSGEEDPKVVEENKDNLVIQKDEIVAPPITPNETHLTQGAIERTKPESFRKPIFKL